MIPVSFDPNAVSNPNNNIFGLPSNEENARVVILPVPWEVTVSYGEGTSRSPEAILKASLQVDLFDPEAPDAWKAGYYMEKPDKKILLKNDYLRKEADLYIDFISRGENLQKNQFMSKALKEINEGSELMNNWVYEKTKSFLEKGKLIALLGGDHSTPLGYYKALGEVYPAYGILQIDAHCDLRAAYEAFTYSHASIMYNALAEVPQIKTLLQAGIRDFGSDEWDYIKNSNYRVITYFDKEIKTRLYDGDTWKRIAEEIVSKLPQQVHISFDIDGLDPKLCPDTGTPVPGGFELDQVFYLFSKIVESGRQLIGCDLCEVGTGSGEWNANVGARILYKLCNLMTISNNNE